MSRQVERPGVREGYDRWSETYDTTPNPLVALDRRITLSALGARAGEHVVMEVFENPGVVTLERLEVRGGRVAAMHFRERGARRPSSGVNAARLKRLARARSASRRLARDLYY